MKRYNLLLLLTACIFVQAAPLAFSAAFYVPPVTGSGISEDDNDFVFNLLSNEINSRDYSVLISSHKADFILTATLSPYEDDNWYYDQVFVLTLSLRDYKTDVLMIEQDIIYSTQEDLSGIFPSIMQSIFALIPAQDNTEAPLDKWLYAGANAFWAPRTYSGSYDSLYLMNFGGGIDAELIVLKYLSLGIGAEISSDWIMISADNHYQGIVLGIPLLVKGFFLSQSADYVLQPYGGVQLNISFNETIKPSLFSGLAGFQFGIRFGPGIFYIDPRVSFDFTESTLRVDQEQSFRRHGINVGIGYKIGFITKGKK